jgi:succinate dehydrogenase / fumarate reductase cytochrome b subunit
VTERWQAGLMADSRPVYLNLIKIRLPVTGIVSLAHRASGVLLFLFIPFAVYLLDLSVQSAQSFAQVQQLLQQPLLILLQILLFWSLAHHFFAGIRFLLIDAEIGIEKDHAIIGSWLVILAEGLTMLFIIYSVML